MSNVYQFPHKKFINQEEDEDGMYRIDHVVMCAIYILCVEKDGYKYNELMTVTQQPLIEDLFIVVPSHLEEVIENFNYLEVISALDGLDEVSTLSNYHD